MNIRPAAPRRRSACARTVFLAALLAASGAGLANAGAPFVTDDPGTVEAGQFELNLSTQYTRSRDEAAGVLPGVELNYGVTPELQIHFFQPLAYSHLSGGDTKFGAGDTELGVKYRLLDESKDDEAWRPALAVFPLVQLPTGDEERGLGSGEVRAFLPLWAGKSFGEWAAFGGGGYFINPGVDNQDFWFAGIGLLRKVTDNLSLGGEIFHTTADAVGGPDSTGFNVGGSYSLTDTQAILLSVGRGLSHADETNRLSAFLSYHIVF